VLYGPRDSFRTPCVSLRSKASMSSCHIVTSLWANLQLSCSIALRFSRPSDLAAAKRLQLITQSRDWTACLQVTEQQLLSIRLSSPTVNVANRKAQIAGSDDCRNSHWHTTSPSPANHHTMPSQAQGYFSNEHNDIGKTRSSFFVAISISALAAPILPIDTHFQNPTRLCQYHSIVQPQ
jgi:hypothetical protein